VVISLPEDLCPGELDDSFWPTLGYLCGLRSEALAILMEELQDRGKSGPALSTWKASLKKRSIGVRPLGRRSTESSSSEGLSSSLLSSSSWV